MVYKIISGLSIILFLGIRGLFGIFARRSGLSINFTDGSNEQQKENRPGLMVIIIIFSIIGLLIFYFIFPSERNPMIVYLPNWIHILGFGLCIISLILQIIVHKAYQDSWYHAKENNLGLIIIKNGPYKWIRHPLYFSIILLLFGMALVTTYIPFIILAICSITFFQKEAINEEKEMKNYSAVEYDSYCKQTGRLFPKVIIPKGKE
jgi:protein-S-isoprenylcysteine O-methyltransferase Ste14